MRLLFLILILAEGTALAGIRIRARENYERIRVEPADGAGADLVVSGRSRGVDITPVVSKVAISRFCRTLGTLISSGVPILQSLNIVRETAGNVIIEGAVQSIHDSVKAATSAHITHTRPLTSFFPPNP